MTTPSSPGGRSRIWIAGVALIGVGVLSGVVGLIGLGTSGDESTSAAPPATSQSAVPPPDSSTAAPPGDGSGVPGTSPLTPGAPGTPGSPGGQTALPGSGSGTPDNGQPIAKDGTSPGTGSEPAAARLPVRVYNNSLIKGLAEKAAEEFRAAGWTVTAVTNYPQGIIPTTTVYYREGTAEKASADEMARRWGMRSEARFAGIQDATPGLIVIVTKDFKAA